MIKYKSEFGYELTKATNGDIGYDVRCGEEFSIMPGKTKTVDTGISFELPDGIYVDVRGKSGINGRGILCHMGLVDTGYRNSIKVCLTNLSYKKQRFEKGEKVAQIVFRKELEVFLKKVDNIDTETERGLKGFGSTGRF